LDRNIDVAFGPRHGLVERDGIVIREAAAAWPPPAVRSVRESWRVALPPSNEF
jgi:hypothetical protein